MVGAGEIPLSEVVGGLSYALDLTEGEPPGHAARACLIGMRVAAEIGLDAAARSDLYYALLLKDAGCSANSARMAALFGADDHDAKRSSKRVDWARPSERLVSPRAGGCAGHVPRRGLLGRPGHGRRRRGGAGDSPDHGRRGPAR